MFEYNHERGLYEPRRKLFGAECRLVHPEWMGGAGFHVGGGKTYQQEVLADAPWAYYPMSETSGTVVQNLGSTSATQGTYGGSLTVNASALLRNSPSVFFNRTGVLNTNLSNNMSSASFSLECLVSPWATNHPQSSAIIGKYAYYAPSESDFPISVKWESYTNKVMAFFSKGDDFVTDVTLTSGSLSPFVTHHVVVNYIPNSTVELWVDGSLVASSPIAFTISVTGYNWAVGRASGEFSGGVNNSGFSGRLSHAAIYYNMTLSAARIAAHYQAFLREREPLPVSDPYWANVVLLMEMEGPHGGFANFLDQSSYASSVTNIIGDVTYSNTRFAGGQTSALFTGASNAGLQVGKNATVGVGAFTLEAYIRPTVAASGRIISAQDVNTTASIMMRVNPNGSVGGMLRANDNTGYTYVESAASIVNMADTEWYHLAFTRTVAGAVSLWLNGAQVASGTNTANVNGSKPWLIGLFGINQECYTGYIDGVRVTEGVCRYSNAFIPPALPYPRSV